MAAHFLKSHYIHSYISHDIFQSKLVEEITQLRDHTNQPFYFTNIPHSFLQLFIWYPIHIIMYICPVCLVWLML